MKPMTLVFTARDVAVVKVALAFAIEFESVPIEVKAHMQQVLARFDAVVLLSKIRH